MNHENNASTSTEEDRLEQIAQNLLNREIRACQSSLIDRLFREYDDEAWNWESVSNIWPNTDDWLFHKCYQLVTEEGLHCPDPNPYKMDRTEMIEMIESTDKSPLDGLNLDLIDDEKLRTTVIRLINDEIIYGLSEWQSCAAEGQPQEVFEWWAVTDWLARHLDAIGEPVLMNDYGNWWGRTCTGQIIMLDGTLQKIARRIL